MPYTLKRISRLNPSVDWRRRRRCNVDVGVHLCRLDVFNVRVDEVCVCFFLSLHWFEWISNGWQWHIVCLFCRQRLSCSRLWSGLCNGTWTFSNLNWYMHFIFGVICCDHFLNINKTNACISHASQPHVRCVHENMNKMIYFIWSHSSFHLEIMQNPLEKQRRFGKSHRRTAIRSTVSSSFLLCVRCPTYWTFYAFCAKIKLDFTGYGHAVMVVRRSQYWHETATFPRVWKFFDSIWKWTAKQRWIGSESHRNRKICAMQMQIENRNLVYKFDWPVGRWWNQFFSIHVVLLEIV